MVAERSKKEQIELLTTNFNYRTLVGEKVFNFSLTKDLLVEEEPARENGSPFPLGDVAAWIGELKAEIAAKERVLLRGKVGGKAVFYAAAGPREVSLPEEDFQREIEMEGAFVGMEVSCRGRAVFSGQEESPLEAEGKLLYRLLIEGEVFLSVVDHCQLEAATGVKEIPPERISRSFISAEEQVKEEELTLELTADFETKEKLAYVKGLNAYLQDFSCEQGSEGVNIKGELVTTAYFLYSEEGEFKESRQQFNRQIPLLQLKKGCRIAAFPRVTSIFHEILEDKVRQRVDIHLLVKATRSIQQEVISDIQGVSVRKEHLLFCEPSGTAEESLELIQKLSFPYSHRMAAGFGRLLRLNALPRDGTVAVNGTIEKKIYYLQEQEPEEEFEGEETKKGKLPVVFKSSDDFEYTLYLPGADLGSEVAAFFTFGAVDFVPTENETLQISHARLEVSSYRKREVPVVVPYRVEPGTSFVIYAVKPGDTLLKIARSYGVRPEALAAANNLAEDDPLQAGEKLLIPMMFYGEL